MTAEERELLARLDAAIASWRRWLLERPAGA
jgi:hypothetical protein